MRIFIPLFIAILSFQICFGQLFTQLNSGTTNTLVDFYFFDATVGFVVGYSKVMKTTDGGATWQDISPNVNTNFSDIYMENVDSGFVVGLDGNILRTLDGGNTWTGLNANTGSNLRRIVSHNNELFMTGQNGFFKKSSDFGNTWTNVNLTTSNELFEIHFTSGQIGFVVGDNGSMFKTNNGGNTWTPVNTNTTLRILNLEFFDANNGICVGGSLNNEGVILRTADGGNTWSVTEEQNSSYQNVAYENSNSVYIVGGNQIADTSMILHSTDGGLTWDFIDLNTNRQVGIQIIDGVIYTCGLNGTIFKSTVETSIRETILPEQLWVYPNPSSNTININLPEPFSAKSYIVSLVNNLGQTVLEVSNNCLLDVNGLPAGNYTLILKGPEASYTSSVLVK